MPEADLTGEYTPLPLLDFVVVVRRAVPAADRLQGVPARRWLMTELRDHKYQEQWEKQIRGDPEVLKDLLGVALLINTEARRDGTRAVMSHPQLAQYLGISVSTAQRHIRRLRELGYLDLVERGHRRGDGTVTANVYRLTLRFTADAEAEVEPWTSPIDDSLQVTQMTDRDPISTGHPDDLLSEVSTCQNSVSTGQIEVSTGQNDVSTGHPGDRPLFNPSLIPPKSIMSAAHLPLARQRWPSPNLKPTQAGGRDLMDLESEMKNNKTKNA